MSDGRICRKCGKSDVIFKKESGTTKRGTCLECHRIYCKEWIKRKNNENPNYTARDRSGFSHHSALNNNSYQRHGMTKTKTYRIWQAMKARCFNKSHKHYDKYGARGIKVCERWALNFLNFFDDMGEKPEGMTLDRINVNGDYEKDNCRWISMSEQNGNKRSRSNTGYLGIRLDNAGYFHVGCTRNGVNKSTTCKTIEEAISKREQFRKELGIIVGDCDDRQHIKERKEFK